MAPPDPLRGFDGSLESFGEALSDLQASGHPPAAAILDGVLTSGGIIDLPPPQAGVVRRTHEAGALWIADEVQSGYGRTGAAMWELPAAGDRAGHRDSRQAHGQRLPVAAVITRRDLAAKFSDADWFSTFGGNPVAMAAAKAVLEVVDDERIVDNARDVGEYLGTRLREIAAQSPVVGEVRQIGLAIGVEIVRPGTTEPDRRRPMTSSMACGMPASSSAQRACSNVLKIRPPLVLQRQHADQQWRRSLRSYRARRPESDERVKHP